MDRVRLARVDDLLMFLDFPCAKHAQVDFTVIIVVQRHANLALKGNIKMKKKKLDVRAAHKVP
jgi:hypothetical protein